MMQTIVVPDDTLRRDIAILSTLAHLHCATALQLHALCFPYHTLATARLTLHYLAEANFLARSPWRLKRERRERGQVWTITSKGHDLLQRYIRDVPALAHLDLARPSTALEHEEWRVRLQVRTFLLRLMLEARRVPLLQGLEIQLPTATKWPTAWGRSSQVEPDALVSIVWHPAARHEADWLPWLDAGPFPATAIQYPIYAERAHTHVAFAELLPIWAATSSEPQSIPILILQDEGRVTAISRQLATLPATSSAILTTSMGLDIDICCDLWRNVRGASGALRPVLDVQVG